MREQLPLDSMIGEAIVMDPTFKDTPNARILPEDLDRAGRALNDRGIAIPPGAILVALPAKWKTESAPARALALLDE